MCQGLDGPPFGYLDADGKHAGLYYELAADIARAVERQLARKLEFVVVRETPMSRVQFIREGRCDFMLLMETAARGPSVDFTDAKFYEIGAAFIAPKSFKASSYADLRGRKVCAAMGSPWITPFESRYGMEIVSFSNPVEVQRALRDKRCIGLLSSDITWQRMQRGSTYWSDYESKFPPEQTFLMGIAFRHGEARLQALYEETIRNWFRTGLIQSLEAKYSIPPNPWAASERARYVAQTSVGQAR